MVAPAPSRRDRGGARRRAAVGTSLVVPGDTSWPARASTIWGSTRRSSSGAAEPASRRFPHGRPRGRASSTAYGEGARRTSPPTCCGRVIVVSGAAYGIDGPLIGRRCRRADRRSRSSPAASIGRTRAVTKVFSPGSREPARSGARRPAGRRPPSGASSRATAHRRDRRRRRGRRGGVAQRLAQHRRARREPRPPLARCPSRHERGVGGVPPHPPRVRRRVRDGGCRRARDDRRGRTRRARRHRSHRRHHPTARRPLGALLGLDAEVARRSGMSSEEPGCSSASRARGRVVRDSEGLWTSAGRGDGGSPR